MMLRSRRSIALAFITAALVLVVASRPTTAQIIRAGLVNLTSMVTGILPVANGGTGASTLAGAGILTGSLGNTQVAVGTGTTTIGGSANLTWTAIAGTDATGGLVVGPTFSDGGGVLTVASAGDRFVPDLYVGSAPALFTTSIANTFLSGDQSIIAYFGSSANRYSNLQTVIETTDFGEVGIQALSMTRAADSNDPPVGILATAGPSGTNAVSGAFAYKGWLRVEGSGNGGDGHIYAAQNAAYVGAGRFTNYRGFVANDLTSGTSTNVGFYSLMSSGAGKYAFYGAGTAQNFFGGDTVIDNGKALKTDTTTAHAALLQAYDVDGTAYKTFATLTNGNTPDFTIAPPSGGTVTLNATTLQQGGNAITLGGAFTTSGAFGLTLTQTALTNVTLPTTGTLATLSGAESLTNKKLGSLTSNGLVKTSSGDGTLSIATGGSDYEVPLTFSTGLTRTTNTVTVNTTQNIAKLSNLTSNGFVKTSGGDGTLSVDTSTYLTAITGGTCTNQVVTAISTAGAPTCTTITSAYVDSSIALTGSTLAQFAATTSAQLAGVLSDETGSGGGFVRATSPTVSTLTISQGSAGSGALTLTGATETTSQPLITGTQTWNASGTTFTALKLNVTNTASASGSLLMDLQVGSASRLTGTLAGNDTKFTVLSTTGSLILHQNGSTSYTVQGGNGTLRVLNSAASAWLDFSALTVQIANKWLSWSTGTNPESGATFLYGGDAANTLNLRNSTNAQIFSVYNTFTSATAFERLMLDFATTANVAMIYTQKGSGGGTARVLQLNYGGTTTAAISIPITSGLITLGNGVITPPVAVGSLPTCNGGAEGAHAAVNDSNAASFTAGIGAVVANGGTTHVPVYCDGTNWRIG